MVVLFAFTAALIATFITTPLVIRAAKKFGMVDDPQSRFHPAHTHHGTIPRAGGLAIYLGIIFAVAYILPPVKIILGIVAGATILMIVGLADDKKDVNPYIRLLTNALAAAITISSGIGIPFITNPLTGSVIRLDAFRVSFEFFGPHSIIVLADMFAFIWILWTINIVGWSAGVDGQMPGFVAIAAIIVGLLSLRFSIIDPSQTVVTILAFIVAGSFIGFLPWNFYPQHIMPGYGGKTLAGFFLAVIGILSYAKLGTAILVLGIPTIDAAYTLIRRLGTGRPLMAADRGHLHHRLLDIGWGKRRIALFYWAISAILGVLSLLINSQQKVFAFLVVAVVIGGFLLWVNLFLQLSKPQGPDSG